MIGGEPQVNSEREFDKEREQTAEEVRSALEFAAENGLEAKLTVLSLDGESSSSAKVYPALLEDVLWVTTEGGEGISVEYARVKKVELPSGPEREKWRKLFAASKL